MPPKNGHQDEKKNVVLIYQNIGCKLLPKEEKKWKSETLPFWNYQRWSGILNHCDIILIVLGYKRRPLSRQFKSSVYLPFFLLCNFLLLISIVEWQLQQ